MSHHRRLSRGLRLLMSRESIADLWSVSGSQEQHSRAALKAIQLCQQLVQGLIPLLICANATPPTCKASTTSVSVQCHGQR